MTTSERITRNLIIATMLNSASILALAAAQIIAAATR